MIVHLGDLVLRFVFAGLLWGLSGINLWQYVTASDTDSRGSHRPRLKQVFLGEAVIAALAGLYLVLATALLLAG